MTKLKAREFEAIFRQYGVEQGTLRILTHLLERINDLEASATIQAQIADKQTDLMVTFTTIANNMREAMEDMKPNDMKTIDH